MPDSYGATAPGDIATREDTGSLETAKHEASELKDTAVTEAGHVAETAKDEAVNVAHEVKSQVKDLYAQTQSELKDQADVQQQRIATGLRSVSRELDSMTANAENPGLAADVLSQISRRLSGAATWLGDRDPGSVISEVKSFARRKPGTFIIGAAVLGLVAGRLTRAFASNASEKAPDSKAGSGSRATYAVAGRQAAPAIEHTPVFAQSASAMGAGQPREDVGDVRSDSL